MNWLKNIFGSSKKEANPLQPTAKHEFQSLVTDTLAKTDVVLSELDALMNKLEKLSPEELARVEWFQNLSELDKKLVKFCGDSGVNVTVDNFAEIKEIMARYAKKK